MAEAIGDKSFLDYAAALIAPANATFSTKAGSAVFWSNDFRLDEHAKPYSRNRKIAEEFAHSNPGREVVFQDRADHIADAMWKKDFVFNGQPVSMSAKSKASAMLSRAFAERASGEVTVYANSTGAGSFFRTNELPAIMANDNIGQVRFRDTEDNELVASKEDWYRWQRRQWVAARIDKLNETVTARAAQLSDRKKDGDNGQPVPQPNQYAVSDFAQEVVSTYRNIYEAPRNGHGYIDSAQERKYLEQMQDALNSVGKTDPTLYNLAISRISKGFDDIPGGRVFRGKFEKDFLPERAPAMATGNQRINIAITIGR